MERFTLKRDPGAWRFANERFVDIPGVNVTEDSRQRGSEIEIVKRSDNPNGLNCVARRYPVTRMTAWVRQGRRSVKDWTATISSSEAWPVIRVLSA